VCVTPNILLTQNIPIFACRRSPAHGLSFFFLENAKHSEVSSSFFCERRKKNERRKNSLNYIQNNRLTHINYSPAGAYPPEGLTCYPLCKKFSKTLNFKHRKRKILVYTTYIKKINTERTIL